MEKNRNKHISDLDDFLYMLNCNLKKIENREDVEIKEDVDSKKEIKKEYPKKKINTNKESKYILILGFVACIIVFLYFCSSLYIDINLKKIKYPFDGDTIDMYDFAEGDFIK